MFQQVYFSNGGRKILEKRKAALMLFKRLEAVSTPFIRLDFAQPHLFIFYRAIIAEQIARL